jgi:polyribonucleotide nucleotidyltransferase
MGLIKEGDKYAILSDILGTEDHLGDMDFKVAGTERGITSIQMDIKIQGLDLQIMTEALTQAREGRLHILGEMAKSLAAPRAELSPYAPRIITVMISPEKIGDLIGPKGKTIRGIQEETGAEITVDDTGTSPSPPSAASRWSARGRWCRRSRPSRSSARSTRARSRARRPSAPSSRSCRAPRRCCTSPR